MESDSQHITARTRFLCVLGHPVEHSVSPEMQNAALAAAGLPLAYAAFSVRPDDLAHALRGLEALGFLGANLTIPHKELAARLVHRASDEARALGAVNTIRFRDGEMEGFNTDVHGFLEPLRRAGLELKGASATVLGAGGAARGVIYALLRSGASVTVINRTEARALKIAEDMGRAVGDATVRVVRAASAAAEESVRHASLLVNATSAGMHPHTDTLPDVEPEWLQPTTVVYDLIYRPRKTRLLQLAERAGCATLDGLPMLVHQGAESLRLWLGIEPDTDRMYQAAERALNET